MKRMLTNALCRITSRPRRFRLSMSLCLAIAGFTFTHSAHGQTSCSLHSLTEIIESEQSITNGGILLQNFSIVPETDLEGRPVENSLTQENISLELCSTNGSSSSISFLLNPGSEVTQSQRSLFTANFEVVFSTAPREATYQIDGESNEDATVLGTLVTLDREVGGATPIWARSNLTPHSSSAQDSIILPERTSFQFNLHFRATSFASTGFARIDAASVVFQSLGINRSVGDFNHDGRLDQVDIDFLSSNIGPGSTPRFDLNSDGSIDNLDRLTLLTEFIGTLEGDADLNLAVGFPDFLILSKNFGSEGGWAQGDFDGTGDVAFSDFLLLAKNFGQSAPNATASVPEPTGWIVGGIGIFFMLLFARHRRRRRGRNS